MRRTLILLAALAAAPGLVGCASSSNLFGKEGCKVYGGTRLDAAVEWMNRLGVRYLRSGISWADWFRPNAEAWFDRQMRALEPFDSTMTLCFTPEHLGIEPHYTSPPRDPATFAEFASWAVRRYASGAAAKASETNKESSCTY